jgi:GTPase KRas
MQDQWFRSGQGFVLVYSIVNRKSFRDAKALYEKILRIKDAKSVPVVLVCLMPMPATTITSTRCTV